MIRPDNVRETPLALICFVSGSVALAGVGVGLEAADPGGPWSVLAVPAIVVTGVWSLGTALSGDRSRSTYERLPTSHGFWAMRFGWLVLGLAWPSFALVALGLLEW